MSNWMLTLLAVSFLSGQMDMQLFLKTVAEKNRSIRALYLEYTQQAKQFYTQILPERPELRIERSEIRNGGSFASANEKILTVSQSFEFPVIYYMNYKTSVLNKSVAYQTYLEQALTTLLAAQKEAYRYLVLEQKKLIVDQFIEHYSMVLEQLRKTKEAGEISELEFLRISLENEHLLNEQSLLESELNTQKINLKLYIPNFNGTIRDTLSTPEIRLTKESVLNEFIAKQPALKRLELELKKKDVNVINSTLNLLPAFTFSYKKQTLDQMDYTGFEFGFSLPLWVPKESENVQHAIINKSITELKTSSELRRVNLFVESLWNTYLARKRSWKRYHDSILPMANTVYTIAEKTYNAGETSYLAFIESYRVWKNARIDALEKQLQLQNAFSEIHQLKLLNYLKVKED